MAATVNELEKKVHTLNRMQRVIRVNELSTLSRIGRLLTKAQNAVSYHQIILNNLRQVQKDLGLKESATHEKPLVVVVSSNRGFCGAYNLNVFAKIDELKAEIGTFDSLVIGKYGKNYLDKASLKIARYINSPIEDITLEQTAEITSWILNKIDRGSYDSVHVIYTQYIDAVRSKAVSMELYPNIPTFENIAKSTEDSLHGNLEGILDFDDDETEMERFLMENYLCGVIYSFLLYSIATEYSARRIAMKNAKDSIEEQHAATLQLKNRQKRQESTLQLMDIIVSASVMEDKENE